MTAAPRSDVCAPPGTDREPVVLDASYYARMSGALQVHLECALEELEKAIRLIPGRHVLPRQEISARISRGRAALARWRISGSEDAAARRSAG